ncbi:MAG: Calx-beta domain-containing protein, partial [Gaiellaceae bacterium]
TLLDHDDTTQSAALNNFGNDYIAGGADDDQIFGQLGSDTIQGDGSIDLAQDVGAFRTPGAGDPEGALTIRPSVDNLATDGDDYIEGGGGNDVIFGNLGQDDIVGDDSDLFSLSAATGRPTGSDTIFGGSGTKTGRNDAGDTAATGHATDADVIAGDNADIFRVVVAAGPYATFNYDSYSAALRLVPRAVELIDYTVGGVTYNPAAGSDRGAADEIHGEAGDDVVYGQVGWDVIYGDAQDDNLVGGYGSDWISGGTGDDGILGDDGRLSVSRIGSTEPLYGIGVDAQLDQEISVSSNSQQAIINPEGSLRYTVDLLADNLDPAGLTTPSAANPSYRPPLGVANDVIYGGFGSDSIHGGAGDDAISGAEAPNEAYTNNYDQNGLLVQADQRSDFFHPYNAGNVLGYNPVTSDPRFSMFALFDPTNALRETLLTPGTGALYTGAIDPNQQTVAGVYHNWLLNFDSNEGPVDTQWVVGSTYAGVPTDGNDMLFGDLQNDWVVGGSGRDVGFLGWGDDVGNFDDKLSTNNGQNDLVDTNPSWEDWALGGAGRDVLIGNTGGDRLVDWSGEFNSYMGPFSPYGEPTTTRLYNNQIADFAYALAKSAGADQTLTGRGGTAARNGEPYGELGLLNQQDPQFGDQQGGSRDPQPGPAHDSRDVRISAGTQLIQAPGTSTQSSAPVVFVDATDTAGAEQGVDPIVFTVFRIGKLDVAVSITLTWSGTASRGTDYTVSVSPGATLSADGLTLTLAANTTMATVTVTPVDDPTAESLETVILALAAGATYKLSSPTSASATIVDNDAAPSISVAASDASGAEQGSDPIVFTVTRNGNPNTQIVVNLTWGGTAIFGTDYTVTVSGGQLSANGQQLTLASGSSTATLTVIPTDDALFEGSEGVAVTVGTGTGYTIGTPASASGTIADNDAAPTVSVAATDADGSEEGPNQIVFTITRGANLNGAIVVNLTWAGTATFGTDYTVSVSGSGASLSANGLQLTLASGSTGATLTVTPVNDTTVEATETVVLTVATGTGYAVGTPSSATGSITDNDGTPSVAVAATDASGAEPSDTILFTVTRSGNAFTQIVVNLTWGGTATLTTDYTVTAVGGTLSGNQLTLAAGATSATLTLTPVDDTVFEGSESVTLTVATGTGYTVGTPASASGTIADDDAAPSVSVAATDASGSEQGSDSITFTLTRSANLNGPITVNLTWGGTATRNTDYTVTAGAGGTLNGTGTALTLAAGIATVTLTLTVVNDTTVEATETVTLALAAGTGYAVGTPASASASITDNDGTPSVSVAASDASGAETASDPIVFTVTRSGNAFTSITVNLALGGTAAAGTDYAVSGGTRTGNTVTVALGAGVTSATVTIMPVDDALVEPSETVTLAVATGTGYSVGTPSTASGTIADNDVNPVVTLSGGGSGSETAPGAFTFTLTRSANTGTSIIVNLTFGGTATAGTDYTVTGGTLSGSNLQVTLASGVTSATITVTPTNDVIVEPTETVTLTIAAGTGYTAGTPSSANGTIADNEPSLFVGDATITEADRQTTTVSIAITLSAPQAQAVTFTITTVAGTALAGTDFQAKTQTLTIAAGQTQVVFQVAIVNDRTAEPSETFTVTIAGATGKPTGTVTIVDNDGALTASAAAPAGLAAEPLTQQQLAGAVARAKAQWLAVRPSADFSAVTFTIGDLPELQLGFALDGRIVVDATAAGWGWARMDLVGVLVHELGHVLGLEHEESGLMADTLAPGRMLAPDVAPATIRVAWSDGWTVRPALKHPRHRAPIRRIRLA